MKLNRLFDIFQDESGATAIEYGLIAALIAAIIVGAVQALGTNVLAMFTNTNAALAPAVGGE